MEDYKRKLELAKERYNSTTSKEEKEFIESLFPELRESEDERIRKELIEFIRHGNCVFDSLEQRNRFWAWLKKQGEKEPIEQDTEIRDLWEYIREWRDKFGRLPKDEDELADCIFYVMKRQKPADRVEPKFKIGDWVIVQGKTLYQIEKVTELSYNHYRYLTTDKHWFGDGTKARLWTIQDAEDGDVLVTDSGRPFIFKGCLDERHPNSPVSYCGIDSTDYFYGYNGNEWWTDENVYPATEEQHDLLFQKMKEAGYEWDAEKKELKKIEQSCYHNDGLYYAIDILEKTLGKVEGYQSDDGKREHQIAIETVNALYHKKPTEWSEEDEKHYQGCLNLMRLSLDLKPYPYYNDYLWFKSLKPQSSLYDKGYNDGYSAAKYNSWKPSEEQMKWLKDVIETVPMTCRQQISLESLYNDLKNFKA